MSQCIGVADLARVVGVFFGVVGFVTCLVGVAWAVSRAKNGEWDH